MLVVVVGTKTTGLEHIIFFIKFRYVKQLKQLILKNILLLLILRKP